MQDQFTYTESPPGIREYQELRRSVNFSPRSEESAGRGLPGSCWVVTVRTGTGRAVGMARMVGDGGCSFLVVDVIVHPDFQGRGIGSEMMRRLDAWIEAHVPDGAMISMLADEPGRRLYERHGFRYTAPESVAMKRFVVGRSPAT